MVPGPGSRRLSIEDLRPATLAGIVGQDESVGRLERIAAAVVEGRMLPPNFLFHGPPGVGKTTAARAFARAVLGEAWEYSFHQLDASDDRSLGTIRERIVPQTRAPPSRTAPVRIFFFDEADALGAEEQSALRPAMEGGDGRTVLILACNRLDAISEPLQSRATRLEFRPMDDAAIRRMALEAVARVGGVVAPGSIDAVVARSHGSAREAIRLVLEELAWAEPDPTPG